MSKYDDLARIIVLNVGGASNIISLTHCITRLRFQLKDIQKAQTDILEHTPGVITVLQRRDQYMLIIGSHVSAVYDAICDQIQFNSKPALPNSKFFLFHSLKKMFRELFSPPKRTYPSTGPTDSIVVSPLSGYACSLEEIDDLIFSSEALGKGCAVEPFVGEVFAPFDGRIVQFAETHHAIGIAGVNGVELLIHVGMETIELNGRYFEPKVSLGDTVKQGQLLLRFDIEAIKKAGYSLTTPIVFINSEDYCNIHLIAAGKIATGQNLLSFAGSTEL